MVAERCENRNPQPHAPNFDDATQQLRLVGVRLVAHWTDIRGLPDETLGYFVKIC
jgi:hypothetical protein